MRFQVRMSVALVGSVALCAATITATAGVSGATLPASVSASATVSSGPEVGSTTQAGTGDTIHNVVTANPSSLTNPTQTTTVTLTGAQTVVPGSVQTPDGTTTSYSTDGTTFTADPTGAAFVRFSGALATGGNGVATPLLGPLNSFATGGSGDGYSPILTSDRVFNIWHHQQGQVDCHVIASGAQCPGYPFADQVAGTTPSTGQTVIGSVDPANPTHLWYPAQRDDGGFQTTIGFNCVNITDGVTPVSCGWVSTGTTANAVGGGASNLTGGGLVAGKLYAIDLSGLVYCVNPAANAGAGAACGGYPVNLGLPTAGDTTSMALSVIGDSTRIIARTNNSAAGPGGTYASTLACLDTTTGAACTGWGVGSAGSRVVDNTPNVTGTSTFAINGDVLAAQSTGASWDSFCGSRNDSHSDDNGVSSTLALACYHLADGSAMATPAGFDVMLPDTTAGWVFGSYGYGHAATFGHRVYFSMFDYNWDNDALGCYDYSTDSVCANYPYINTAAEATTGLSTYAVAVDSTGTCLWTYGDDAVFTLGTAANPALGCSSSTTSATTLPVTPANNYCGTDNSGAAWGDVAVRNLPIGDYTSASVTVRDSNGAAVTGFDAIALSSSQTIDISSIPKSGLTARLSVEVDFAGINGAAFQTNQAAVETTWTSSDSPTFCFDTMPSVVTCLTGGTLGTSASTVFTDEPSGPLAPVTGSTSMSDIDAAATGCSTGGGTPVAPVVSFHQIGGSDRDATAALLATTMYPTAGSANVVVLARDDVYADGLTGSPLASALDGPLLLTPSASLSTTTQAAIAKVLPAGGRVICLGGTSALSATVVAQLQALGYQVQRIGGVDRFATATDIATTILGHGEVTHVYLATGINFADALPAADAAGLHSGVILLSDGTALPGATSSWMAGHAGMVTSAIGGSAAAADPAAFPMVGPDRYATAAQVAAAVAPAATGVVLATGTNFPDGLAGAVYAVFNGWSLLLLDPGATTLNAEQASYLHNASGTLGSVTAIGSTTALPTAATGLVTGGLH